MHACFRLLMALAAFLAIPAVASPGDMDLTFGTGGKVQVPIPRGADVARTMTTDSLGRVIAAGYAERGFSNDMAVVRYNTDGTLDTSFAGTGKRLLALSEPGSYAFAVAVDASGRIVLGGAGVNGLTLVRLTTNGDLDPTFGIGGVAGGLAPFGAAALVIDGAGRIVAVGGASNQVGVIRVNANGALDTSFGGTGLVMTTLSTNVNAQDDATAVAIDAAGRIVVAGHGRGAVSDGVAVARFNANGTLDTTFNGTGKVLASMPGFQEQGTGVAIQSDGRIVVSGTSNSRMLLVRFTAAGSLDGSFGAGGRVIPTFEGAASATAVTIDAGGRILVAGYAQSTAGGYTFALARYLQSGTLDPAFGLGGKTTVASAAGTSSLAFAVDIDVAGRIVCAGLTQSTHAADFGVARRLPDGAPDPSFGSGGIIATNIASSGGEINAIARQADGRIVYAGGAYDPSATRDFIVGRLNADGSTDTTFGPAGQRTTAFGTRLSQATGVAIDSAGRIVAAGDSTGASFQTLVTVVRHLPDGTLDPSFGSGGTVTYDAGGSSVQTNGVAIDAFDRVVIAGRIFNGASNDMLVVRFNANGTLDTSFAGSGKVLIDFPGAASDHGSGLAIDSAGRIVVAGSTNTFFSVARLGPEGSLDASFNSTGRLTVPTSADSEFAFSVAIDALDRIVMAGQASSASGVVEQVVRITSSGALDASFNGTGKFVVSSATGNSRAYAVIVDGAGRPMTAGFAVAGGVQHLSLRRYTANGVPDSTFGASGLALAPFTTTDPDIAFALALQPDGRVIAGGIAYLTNPPTMVVVRMITEETPTPFAFTSQAGVALSTLVTSNSITVSGVASLVPVSIANGEYSVGCNGIFTNVPGQVSNSSTVCVRHASSGLPNASTVTRLTLGAASATFTSVTGKAMGSVSVTSSASPSPAGTQVTFTATVSGFFGTPTGTVTFKVDGATIGAASLNGSGQAQVSTSQLIAGSRAITVAYAGDALYLGATSAPLTQAVSAALTITRPRADIGGDRKADLVWRDATGGLALWTMDGPAIVATYFGVVGTEWQVADVGDANGDGKADLFWWNATLGSGYLWFLNGTSITGFASLGILGPEWTMVGAGDFNGDGKSDVLFRRSTDGLLYVFILDGGTITSQGAIGNVASAFQIIDIADTDGDGKVDIVFRNTTDGGVTIWKMNGLSVVSSTLVGAIDANFWQLVAAADFNGDGKADLLWKAANGDTWIWFLNGGTVASAAEVGNLGPGWRVSGVSDFTGDGKADIIWRFVDGTTYLWIMNNAAIQSTPQIGNPGGSWQIVAP